MLRFACNDWAPAFAGELLFPLPHFLSGHPGLKHLRSGEGLRIGRLQSIVEGGAPTPVGSPRLALVARDSGLSPGEAVVTVTVTATWELVEG